MVRRNYILLATYSSRLSNRLGNVIVWARGNRGRRNVKQLALKRAKRIFDKYFDLLMPYIWRTRIQRQLGKDAIQLSDAEVEKLGKLKVEFLANFEDVLDDALS